VSAGLLVAEWGIVSRAPRVGAVILYLHAAAFGGGLVSGFGVGLFFVAPWILTNHAFAGRPGALWWIDAGHVVLACSAIGLVLGVFL
jgi:hypothetical protein